MASFSNWAGLTFLALAGCQQSAATSMRPTGDFDRAIRQSIAAHSDGGHGFEILRGADGTWEARVFGRERPRRVSLESCPELSAIIADFERLPPVSAGWPEPSGDPPTLSIPPTRKHGEDWRVSSAGFFPDVSQVNLTIQGDQGPYAGWAAATFARLASCPSV
jgi:hypothetical protein